MKNQPFNNPSEKSAPVTTDSNDQTINAYNNHVKEYIEHTSQNIDDYQPEMRQWIDYALNALRPGGSIFEIGSATLRDASYMRDKGYDVTCSDAARNFVQALQDSGHKARVFNVLHDEFTEKYDMVFANGVFPHFTAEETRYAFKNIANGLTEKGLFAFCLKYGTGDEWIVEKFEDKRFTHFWKREDLFALLNEEGYEVLFENDNKGSYPSHRWLNIVCRRIV